MLACISVVHFNIDDRIVYCHAGLHCLSCQLFYLFNAASMSNNALGTKAINIAKSKFLQVVEGKKIDEDFQFKSCERGRWQPSVIVISSPISIIKIVYFCSRYPLKYVLYACRMSLSLFPSGRC